MTRETMERLILELIGWQESQAFMVSAGFILIAVLFSWVAIRLYKIGKRRGE